MADESTGLSSGINEFTILRSEISNLSGISSATAKALEDIQHDLVPQIQQILARNDVWKEQVETRIDAHTKEFEKIRIENKARDKVLYTVLTVAFIACILFPIILTKFHR